MNHINPIEMQEVTDAKEIAIAQEQRKQFDENSAWLQANFPEIYSRHRGKFICIAAQQVFIGETVQDAVAQAKIAHPEDAGWFTRYIPKEKVPRIYAV